MRYKILFFVLICLGVSLLAVRGARASRADEYQAEINNLVNTQWQNFIKDKSNFQGGVALYVISPKGNFYANAGMPGCDQNTHFRTGSVSKTFTAAAIMLLYQQGKLKLDDYITSTIPGSTTTYIPINSAYNIPYVSSITIRMLLTHTGGVFDITNQDIPSYCNVPYRGQEYDQYVLAQDAYHTFTFDEIIGVISTCGLSSFIPGTNFGYTNTGYFLLGEIIQRISGEAYSQFVTDNLLKPNSLNNTTVPYLGTDRTVPSPYESGLAWKDGVVKDFTVNNLSLTVAAGSVITTPSEIAVWIRSLLRGEAGLSASAVSQMTSAITTTGNNYGFGLMSVSGLGIGHDGAVPGYLTEVFYDPGEDVAVVVSAGGVDWFNTTPEEAMMIELGKQAKAVLGYPASGAAENLSALKAFPNPFNSKQTKLTIANLPAAAAIRIYNAAGELIRRIDYTAGNGQVLWDGKNDGGSLVASGVYIININSAVGNKKIKVAIQK